MKVMLGLAQTTVSMPEDTEVARQLLTYGPSPPPTPDDVSRQPRRLPDRHAPLLQQLGEEALLDGGGQGAGGVVHTIGIEGWPLAALQLGILWPKQNGCSGQGKR